MAIRRFNAPLSFKWTTEFLAPTAYYFSQTTRGRPPLETANYTQIDPPGDIPGYALANTQDFYLTPAPQFVISLFLSVPSLFFSEFDAYQEITITNALRLDSIAYKYYLNVEYWWIIAIANDILDPFTIPVGKIIRIPSEHMVITQWLQRPIKKVRDADTFFFGTR